MTAPIRTMTRIVNRESELLAKYLTARQLANQLGVSTKTLHRWALSNQGPPKTYLGNKLYYRTEAVLKWIEDREGKPA